MSDTGKANKYTYELRYYLQSAQNKDELVFIQDEKSGNLLYDFLGFYQRPIFMFKNAHLIFDEELNIQDKMKEYDLMIDDTILTNYQFIKSEDSVMIQLSDVFVGILARYFRFINTNISNVYDVIDNFSKNQLSSFCKLNLILNISVSENPAFWDMFLCNDMRRIFTDLVEKYSA